MIKYIMAVKRGFRDQHNFAPIGGSDDEPIFNEIPDGDYLIKIEGRIDKVKIENGQINCCNFCLLYTSPSPRDQRGSRMPSSA